jgi:hypothetical protein
MLFSFFHWQTTDANTRKADSVYVLFCEFKMFKVIKCPTNCEIQSVNHFLNAKNVKPADIDHQICEVYGENAVNDGMVRKCVRMFNKGHDNVHDMLQISWPSVVSGVFTGGHVLKGGDKETGAPL